MSRTCALIGVALLGCSGVDVPPRADIDAAMRHVADAWIVAHPTPGGAGWDLGVHYWGLSALYAESGDRRYFDRVHEWGQANDWQPYGAAVTDDADHTVCGMAYWNQHDAGDPAASIANVVPSLLSQRAATYPWIDLFFMGFPLSARYGQASGDDSFAAGVYRIFEAEREALYARNAALWWRDARWAGSDVFWARGNGWVLAGLAASLEYLPANDARRRELADMAKAMVGRLVALQKPDGFWSSALLPTGGYDSTGPETTGTALFTFAIARLVHLGVLERERYLPVAAHAWRAMASTAIQPDGSLGYCQPGDDKPLQREPTAHDTADFCVGAFLLAGNELVQVR